MSLVQLNDYNTNEGEYGTEASGFGEGGPFSCMNCVWRTPHSTNAEGKLVDSCRHPKVMADPELQECKLPDGTIEVDWDDCCRYVRPPKDEDDFEESEDRTLIYFFRHGQTTANADNKFRGFTDFPLDDLGIKQAKESAAMLADVPFDGFYSSDLTRAQQTLNEICSVNCNWPDITIEMCASGRPWHVGEFAGTEKTQEAQEALKSFADNPEIPIPGGESLCEFQSRFSALFCRVVDKARKEKKIFGISGHASNGHEIGHILYDDIDSLDTDPGGIVEIYEHDGKLEGRVIKNPPEMTGNQGYGKS